MKIDIFLKIQYFSLLVVLDRELDSILDRELDSIIDEIDRYIH
jgi:hypothetical protein